MFERDVTPKSTALQQASGGLQVEEQESFPKGSTPPPLSLDASGYSLHGNTPEGIEFSLATPDASDGRVTRLSPMVAWVMPSQPEALPVALPHALYLKGNGTVIGPLRGQPLSTPVARGAPVGIQLLDVSAEQGRQILAMLGDALRRGVAEPAASALPVQEVIVDRHRIRTVLNGISAVGNKGVLRRVGQTMRIAIEHFDPQTDTVYWRTVDEGMAWGEPPYDIDVIGYNSAFRLQLEAARVENGLVRTTIPSRLFRIRHRWHRRVPAPPAVRLRFQHPLWPDLPARDCEAVDISLAGLRVKTAADDLLFPGLILPRIELHCGGGEPVLLHGEVRYVVDQGGQGICGLSVAPLPECEVAWVRFVSQTLCPTTSTSENLIEPLWELFARSGYFNLAGKTADDFDEVKASFVNMARRAAQIPQLFCQTVWPSDRGIEATLSFMKPYKHSWMGHQLAKRLGKPPTVVRNPGQILLDIYLRSFEHCTSDPEHRWCMGYLESNTAWVERAHIRHAKRLMANGEAYAIPVRLMHAHSHGAQPPSGKFDIGPATPGEKRLVVEHIARTRPHAYIDALDFSAERFDMHDISRVWQGFGLRRGREVRVARRLDGTPLAALILETGQSGTNLFGLLDAARIFPLHSKARETYVELLDEARRWYAALGCEAFTFLREDDDASYAEAARLEDSAEAAPYLWIIPAKVVPDFLEHVSELSVGRVPRSRNE